MAIPFKTVKETVQKQLKAADRPENRMNAQQFFKEQLDQPIVLRSAVLRKISNDNFRTIRQHDVDQILDCCDLLLKSDLKYRRFFAFDWAEKLKGKYRTKDFKRFESWLKQYVDNWSSCDHLCCGSLGKCVYAYPEVAPKVFRWHKSNNRWLRRASAVALIVSVRRGKLLDEVFATAEALLTDPDDLVQKGYGWMLKVACGHYEPEVFNFVLKHKREMPRTALRYAIEKMPPAKKKVAMAK